MLPRTGFTYPICSRCELRLGAIGGRIPRWSVYTRMRELTGLWLMWASRTTLHTHFTHFSLPRSLLTSLTYSSFLLFVSYRHLCSSFPLVFVLFVLPMRLCRMISYRFNSSPANSDMYPTAAAFWATPVHQDPLLHGRAP